MTEGAVVPFGFVGRKVGMTRLPDGDELTAVTLIKLEQQKITAVRTNEKHGYDAVQVGYHPKREKLLTKPDIGRLRKAGIEENFARFKEFRESAKQESGRSDSVGKRLHVDMLKDIEVVDVQGLVKGRGFQGVVRRWGHSTGRSTHGSRFHRRPGSLGCRTEPGRVFKNKKLPGRMGGVQRTIQNLRIVGVDAEQQVVAIRGAVPGNRGSFVVLRPAIKREHKVASKS